ncbi:MAG: hypothetical protein LBJ00_17700 [Planctomycetaceae bacterium]|nr:hypothetical protein [Planctomycetaceae bacterium]
MKRLFKGEAYRPTGYGISLELQVIYVGMLFVPYVLLYAKFTLFFWCKFNFLWIN